MAGFWATAILLGMAVGQTCGSLEASLLAESTADQRWTIQHRRELHKIPELKFEEHQTSKYIKSALAFCSAYSIILIYASLVHRGLEHFAGRC